MRILKGSFDFDHDDGDEVGLDGYAYRTKIAAFNMLGHTMIVFNVC